MRSLLSAHPPFARVFLFLLAVFFGLGFLSVLLFLSGGEREIHVGYLGVDVKNCRHAVPLA